ncbi:OsmC family protein [Cellulomonas hominis]|uniref:OsmC family protein n=1 Tax=Cellulomonas hominis TaxID=156981 RepID=UPI0014442F93|nr:OsmC family protein [Cellulomonas hominis]MBU5423478.1 OsmC family protein [Cellulomonas hominis]NKY11212.1 OsmC family protein [Cellulomonas hominis]
MEPSTVPETAAATAVPTQTPAPQDRLWVERTGTRTYTGRNTRGAEVSIGPVEAGAVFTPGELLKIALAGCSGMSADHALSHRLGDDVAVTVEVEGANLREEDRYPHLQERMIVDLTGLDEATRERLLRVVHRAVDEHCTVGRTVKAGATVDLEVVGE